MIKPVFEYKDIAGISQQEGVQTGYIPYAMNVDSDNEKKLHRRRGKIRAESTSTHSVWSNEDICLCVQGGDLKEATLNTSTKKFSYTTLLSGVGNSVMVFQDVADMVFFSNSDVFGYIREHDVHGLPEITQTFKARMTGGYLMAYWDSRLWVFQDNILIYSDAGMPMVRDSRHNFVPFNGKGRMLVAVKDGLYVSDSTKCGFLQGGIGDPPKFNYTEVCNVPCIEGIAMSSVEQIQGTSIKVAFWATEDGCYMGLPGGQVTRVTGEHFHIDGAEKGRGLVLLRVYSDQVRIRQFLGVYDLQPGYGGMEFGLEVSAAAVSGRITTA